MGVRRRVAAVAEVGLQLDDAADEQSAVAEPAHQVGAEQFRRDVEAGTFEEGTTKRGTEKHAARPRPPTRLPPVRGRGPMGAAALSTSLGD